MTESRELNRLQNELADRIEAHRPENWDTTLLRAVIAVLDLYPEREAAVAPVLTLIPGRGAAARSGVTQ